jgi:hypothetical protein
MVRATSGRISRVPPYSGYHGGGLSGVRGFHPLRPAFPDRSASLSSSPDVVRNPGLRRFGLFRFRSPLLTESHSLSFPPGNWMFQFPGLSPLPCGSGGELALSGFPHSEIRGSMAASASPRLIAGSRVLLRLSVPRHPPVALSNFLMLSFE